MIDNALESGADADATALAIIRPALYEVGIRWANAEITVGDEHLASATAAIALEHLAERSGGAATPDEAMPALVACVEGEQHALGARVIADALDRSGWSVLYCGASTPIDDIAAIVSERGVRLVALSVGSRAGLVKARAAVKILHALEPRPHVLVGGQACHHRDDCPEADDVAIGSDYRPLLQRLRPVGVG